MLISLINIDYINVDSVAVRGRPGLGRMEASRHAASSTTTTTAATTTTTTTTLVLCMYRSL